MPATLKTISGLTGVLARAGGALVGLSALAYFVGYKIQNAYLSQAGANWAINLFSASELVREGQGVILIIGITLFISVVYLFGKEGTAEKLRRIDIVLSGISIALLVTAYITSTYWGNHKTDYSLSILAGIFMAAAAGFTIGELIARLDESESKWNRYHLTLLMFFYVSAIAMAPYFMGSNKAKLDLEPTLSSLPIVKIAGEDSGKWHLVRAIGDNYLLVALTEASAQREFRLIPISSDVVVSSTGKNE